ncbi:GlyGly-CTERM sorting domain-containing protein [Vibrio chagasii]|nr:GlyGly-CTERM sorting domain-containing protein [Vibrio chagasii]CAH6886472.1 GlyGly-CTERM sorting domain-containing protein [Vibrio chagasii]CAH6927666.1 GlyGly-CTERM sorting domain-containing protein [Vibrio chagasii]CAH6933373.1 GlyGly-CTERM sorting domain-containing protein [Vibrio chagasii]CAH6942923.1 GlyGly-CTERM sorting domain-containing protein [Vibrio chagasii]
MTCTKFKLTTVAALVLAATNANAALYKVVEVTPSITGASEIFGVAIQPGSATDGTNDLALGCFDSAATNCADTTFKLAGETRNTVEAISYREEVPFAMDAPFQYIQEFDDFENYCYRELRYSTCESWAQNRWNDTWSKERNDLNHVNAKAFIEGGATYESRNTVINSLDNDAKPLGVKSEGDIRNNALFTTTSGPTGTSETRAWKAITASNGTVYNVGSVSEEFDPTDTSEPDEAFASKAAIWDDTTTKEIDWIRSGNAQEGDYFAQGSMRSIVESNSVFYGVGYNTENGNGDLQDMNASVFVSDSLDLTSATWTTKQVGGAEVKSGSSNDDARYSNSVATDINENLFAVGYAKRNGYVPENGSAGNKIFVVTDAANPTATFLSGGIFFSGSSGEAKAVNNYNEFVGQIDAETTREVDGSERRHRGFIYPYQANGTDASRIALFQSKAWWLDDLTNDGDASGENNKFRIIDATDINDAGVISATAIKCTVGGTAQPYDTTSHNSYCGGASSNAVEEVVAVKLVPIAGKTQADIQARSADSEKVDRQGGSLGWLTLTVLGLLGFRRKFK